jgi:hypothetical protein
MGSHNLGLSELLAVDADRTSGDLKLGKFNELVSFYVRTESNLLLRAILLKPKDISFHDVSVYQNSWRVDIMNFHWQSLALPKVALGQGLSRQGKGLTYDISGHLRIAAMALRLRSDKEYCFPSPLTRADCTSSAIL